MNNVFTGDGISWNPSSGCSKTHLSTASVQDIINELKRRVMAHEMAHKEYEQAREALKKLAPNEV